ncbi:hypothetical protein TNCV_983901 [Trichonephila clavipes]|nr:hypothetical protein TNCV_983901 [Trichonephila clavipes]
MINRKKRSLPIRLSALCMSLVEFPYVLLNETITKTLWDTGAEKSFISEKETIEEQRRDRELGHIYRYLENPEDSLVNVTICEKWSHDFQIVEGLLFYAKYAATFGEMGVYIPQLLRGEIMREFPDKPIVLREFAYALRTAVPETPEETPAELFLSSKLITPFHKLEMVSDGADFMGCQAYRTRVGIPESSSNNIVNNSWSRIKGTDDPVITFPDRVDTLDSSPDNKVANSWSRVRGMEGPVITFPDKVDTPDSKIAWRLMEVQRVGGPHHLKSILETSRKE